MLFQELGRLIEVSPGLLLVIHMDRPVLPFHIYYGALLCHLLGLAPLFSLSLMQERA